MATDAQERSSKRKIKDMKYILDSDSLCQRHKFIAKIKQNKVI